MIDSPSEKIKEKYFLLDELIKILQNDRDDLLEDYIKESCPYKFDEKVTIWSWQHLGEEGIVTEINVYPAYNRQLYWEVKGLIVDEFNKLTGKEFVFNQYDYDKGPDRLKLRGLV